MNREVCQYHINPNDAAGQVVREFYFVSAYLRLHEVYNSTCCLDSDGCFQQVSFSLHFWSLAHHKARATP